MIKVLFFGPVAEQIGQRSVEMEYRQGLSLRELRETLAARHPQAFAMVAFAAVNGAQARDADRLLADGSEVAFMAKFSGG